MLPTLPIPQDYFLNPSYYKPQTHAWFKTQPSLIPTYLEASTNGLHSFHDCIYWNGRVASTTITARSSQALGKSDVEDSGEHQSKPLYSKSSRLDEGCNSEGSLSSYTKVVRTVLLSGQFYRSLVCARYLTLWYQVPLWGVTQPVHLKEWLWQSLLINTKLPFHQSDRHLTGMVNRVLVNIWHNDWWL